MTNGWSKYQEMVLYRLDKIDRALEELRQDIISLKTKAAMYGGGAAIVLIGTQLLLERLLR